MADLTTNNIHYYGYAANANDSIGSTNGTVDGASNVSGGITGNCYSYDGNNDRIIYGTTTAPADLMWGTGTSYSISLWVNPSTLVGTGQMGLCAAFFRHGFSVQTNTGRITIGQRSSSVSVNKTSTLVTITAATWTHLAITYSPDTRIIRLYKNGVYGDSLNVSSVTGDTSYTIAWHTGSNQAIIGGTGAWFNGLMDELSFWNRTLTDVEIEALYNRGIGNFYPYNSYWKKKYNGIQFGSTGAKLNGINKYFINKINGISK